MRDSTPHLKGDEATKGNDVLDSVPETRSQRAKRLLATVAGDPVTALRALPGEILQRHGGTSHSVNDDADEDWDEHLHGLLGVPWPCNQGQRLEEVVSAVKALLAARNVGFGRGTYGYYSDADLSLCRAVWCTVTHTRPEVVIETGVAHGVTSRIVLEALNANDRGHLWSIDLPHPFNHRLHSQIGIAVTDACRARWSYVEGSSRQRLPSVVTQVGSAQIFIHDSLHTAPNTVFEMNQAARVMPPGGVMLVDDISTHRGFSAFARRHPEYQAIVCPSADKIGQFGIAVKLASA
jgi:hypothetical protein